MKCAPSFTIWNRSCAPKLSRWRVMRTASNTTVLLKSAW